MTREQPALRKRFQRPDDGQKALPEQPRRVLHARLGAGAETLQENRHLLGSLLGFRLPGFERSDRCGWGAERASILELEGCQLLGDQALPGTQ